MKMTDLATPGEIAEVTAAVCSPFNEPNHDRRCRREHLRLRFAFVQPGYGDWPPTPFWHVMSEGPSKHSTLSMQGLREWGLI